VKLRPDVVTIIGCAYPDCDFGERNSVGSSSKLRLLVINLASVPDGQWVNSQLHQVSNVVRNATPKLSIYEKSDSLHHTINWSYI